MQTCRHDTPGEVDRVAPRGGAEGVEWFFSARALCDVMERVEALPLMGINPGVARATDWDRVAYKGGSEPGVLSLVTSVRKGDHRHCVAATWNADVALDQTRFFGLYGRVLGALRGP